MNKNRKIVDLLFSKEKTVDVLTKQQVMDSNGNYIYPSDYVMDSPNQAYSTIAKEIYK